MNEAELVEGQEYEGSDGAHRWRGTFRLVRNSHGPDPARRVVEFTNGIGVFLDTLRRVSPVSAVAEKDRLFETGCITCGKPDHHTRSSGPHVGYKYCVECNGQWPCSLDAEITRRKQLVASSIRHCDKCMNPAVQGATLCQAHVRSLGKPVEFCACGAIATYADPHNDGGDVPMEFCLACREKEERRLAEGPTADDLAQRVRTETLAAEERRRKHYEERRLAYKQQRDDNAFDVGHGPIAAANYAAAQAHALDAAIARVKPKTDDGPAYVNLNWPPADESDP